MLTEASCESGPYTFIEKDRQVNLIICATIYSLVWDLNYFHWLNWCAVFVVVFVVKSVHWKI